MTITTRLFGALIASFVFLPTCNAATIPLALVSFDGPTAGTWVEAPWSSPVSTFLFVDPVLTGNTLTGGTFNVSDFWVENYVGGIYQGAFIDNTTYYLSLGLRDYNVFDATFIETTNTYRITVFSGFVDGSGARLPMTYEVMQTADTSAAPLPQPLFLLLIGSAAMLCRQVAPGARKSG